MNIHLNAWGELSLAAVAANGLFASDEALRDEEYLCGLADEAACNALPFARKVQIDAVNYWHDFETRALNGYENFMMDARLKHSVSLAVCMTNDWCEGRWDRVEAAIKAQWLHGLNRALDKHRARYRAERAVGLRIEVAGWERAALARLGAHTTVIEAPAAALAEAA
ncbi:MAG: hypothetical protein WC455_19065 [Dehalococcoidia bacterium]|jgi:hypothetical protein